MNGNRHRLLFTVIFFISAVSANAQPKALGVVSSFKGFAVSYEHNLHKEDLFIEMALSADASEMFLYRADYPGISASFTWNHVFASWSLPDGAEMKFFAGPGLAVGYGKDFKAGNGYFFGLKGKVGIECSFERRVTVSACISPILGMHVIPYDEYLSLKYYRNGIFYSPIPEIGIKYRF